MCYYIHFAKINDLSEQSIFSTWICPTSSTIGYLIIEGVLTVSTNIALELISHTETSSRLIFRSLSSRSLRLFIGEFRSVIIQLFIKAFG